MDLRLVETFLQVARRGSFTAAAKALEVSTGAVSQNVKSLERQLETRLFTRTTRRVQLTPEGERFFQRVEPAHAALVGAAQSMAEERDEMQGLVRITSTSHFGRVELIPALAAFMTQHPGVQVELHISDQFVDLVAEQFDLAIRGGVLPVNDYVSRLLIPVTPLVCASPAYAKKHGLPEKIEDIAGHACIGMRSNPTQRVFAWEFKRGRLPFKLDIEPRFVVNDPEGAARAAAAGLGLAQVGSNVVMPLVEAGLLKTALTEHAVASRGIYAVYPSRRYLPKRVSRLLEHLVQSFEGYGHG